MLACPDDWVSQGSNTSEAALAETVDSADEERPHLEASVAKEQVAIKQLFFDENMTELVVQELSTRSQSGLAGLGELREPLAGFGQRDRLLSPPQP